MLPRHPFARPTGIERTQARARGRSDRSEAGANRGGRGGGSAPVVAQGAAVSAEHHQVGTLGDGGSMVFLNDPVRRAPTSFSGGPRGVEFGSSIVIPRTTGSGADAMPDPEATIVRFASIHGRPRPISDCYRVLASHAYLMPRYSSSKGCIPAHTGRSAWFQVGSGFCPTADLRQRRLEGLRRVVNRRFACGRRTTTMRRMSPSLIDSAFAAPSPERAERGVGRQRELPNA
jgi:hypothetical protein